MAFDWSGAITGAVVGGGVSVLSGLLLWWRKQGIFDAKVDAKLASLSEVTELRFKELGKELEVHTRQNDQFSTNVMSQLDNKITALRLEVMSQITRTEATAKETTKEFQAAVAELRSVAMTITVASKEQGVINKFSEQVLQSIVKKQDEQQKELRDLSTGLGFVREIMSSGSCNPGKPCWRAEQT